MTIKLAPNNFFVFDLDDTLFSEIDYLKSAFRAIANYLAKHIGLDIYPEMWQRFKNKENVFEWIITHFSDELPLLTKEILLKQYREHIPQIRLARETEDFLFQLKKCHIPMGLITDGRSITQRNKLKALGIEDFFCDIIVSEEFGSEKPDKRNYMFFEDKYPGNIFFYRRQYYKGFHCTSSVRVENDLYSR